MVDGRACRVSKHACAPFRMSLVPWRATGNCKLHCQTLRLGTTPRKWSLLVLKEFWVVFMDRKWSAVLCRYVLNEPFQSVGMPFRKRTALNLGVYINGILAWNSLVCLCPYTSKYLLRRDLEPPKSPQTPSQKVLGGLGCVVVCFVCWLVHFKYTLLLLQPLQFDEPYRCVGFVLQSSFVFV